MRAVISCGVAVFGGFPVAFIAAVCLRHAVSADSMQAKSRFISFLFTPKLLSRIFMMFQHLSSSEYQEWKTNEQTNFIKV